MTFQEIIIYYLHFSLIHKHVKQKKGKVLDFDKIYKRLTAVGFVYGG